MTKIEFNDLFDLLCYGHDADISIIGQRYFLEWCTNGLIIYPMKKDSGQKIISFLTMNLFPANPSILATKNFLFLI